MKKIATLTFISLLSIFAYAEPAKFELPIVDSALVQNDTQNNLYIIIEKNNVEQSRENIVLEDNSAYLRKNILKYIQNIKQNDDTIGIVQSDKEHDIYTALEEISRNKELVNPQLNNMISKLQLTPNEQVQLFNQLSPTITIPISFEKQGYGKLTIKRISEKNNNTLFSYSDIQHYYIKSLETKTRTTNTMFTNSFGTEHVGVCKKMLLNNSIDLSKKDIEPKEIEDVLNGKDGSIKVTVFLCNQAALK